MVDVELYELTKKIAIGGNEKKDESIYMVRELLKRKLVSF